MQNLFMTFSVCILGLSQIPSSELWSIGSNQEQIFEALRQEGGSEQDSGQSQPDISTFWAEVDDAVRQHVFLFNKRHSVRILLLFY